MNFVSPQGRVTLQPESDVWTADYIISNTIYYVPADGAHVPVCDSVLGWQTISVGAGLVLALDSAIHKRGNAYDLFIGPQGALSYGPPWPTLTSSLVSRGIARDSATGFWVNQSLSTWVGSFYCDADAIVTVSLSPVPVYGGCNNLIGLYNVYNQRPITSINVDRGPTSGMWINQSANMEYFDKPAPGGGENNKITWLDGRGDVNARLSGQITVSGASTNAGAITIGVGYDKFAMSDRGQGNILLNQAAFNSGNQGCTVPIHAREAGSIGLHYFVLVVRGTSVPVHLYGNSFSGMELHINV